MRLPGQVGAFVRMVDVQDRISQGMLLWVPVIIRKAMVWEEISVLSDQEPPQLRRVPMSDICADFHIGPGDRGAEAS